MGTTMQMMVRMDYFFNGIVSNTHYLPDVNVTKYF